MSSAGLSRCRHHACALAARVQPCPLAVVPAARRCTCPMHLSTACPLGLLPCRVWRQRRCPKERCKDLHPPFDPSGDWAAPASGKAMLWQGAPLWRPPPPPPPPQAAAQPQPRLPPEPEPALSAAGTADAGWAPFGSLFAGLATVAAAAPAPPAQQASPQRMSQLPLAAAVGQWDAALLAPLAAPALASLPMAPAAGGDDGLDDLLLVSGWGGRACALVLCIARTGNELRATSCKLHRLAGKSPCLLACPPSYLPLQHLGIGSDAAAQLGPLPAALRGPTSSGGATLDTREADSLLSALTRCLWHCREFGQQVGGREACWLGFWSITQGMRQSLPCVHAACLLSSLPPKVPT